MQALGHSSVQTFLNAQNSLGGHANNLVTAPVLKSIKFYFAHKRRRKR